MKKTLLIVESPAKIKTISKFLGNDFRVMSTVGHIKDLPPKKLGVTINGSIELEYQTIKGKEKVIADICKEASKSDVVLLAPDPDREGEIIAWHIGEEIKKVLKKKGEMHRITYNEITKEAILEAIQNLSDVDMNKVAAQQARRVLDRWVGYEVSPILWKKIAPGLSAGRVQSVALRLICDREIAIREFKPEEYWSIEGIFAKAKDQIKAALTHINKKKIEIGSQKEADKVVAEIKKADYVIDSITDKERIKNPMPPFMTSTLQQAAFNRLGFSVKKTMQIAQQLYEGIALEDASTPVALITYMRTDSLRLSDTALKQARDYISKHFSKEYLPSKAIVYAKSKGGKAQDAHEAIRPITISRTPEQVSKYLPRDAARLYELIWKRTVACQMKPALYAQRQVIIKGGAFTFKVTGSTLMFDGFLKVYSADEDEEKDTKVIIPNSFKEKDSVDLTTIDPKQHFTQPPPRFTEGSLIKELEKEGIGRPSTYSAIISTIQARSYTELDTKKRFTPTELGMTVTKLLVENLPNVMDPKFTATMEEDLDKIAQGDVERDKILRSFHKTFQTNLKEFIGKEGTGKIAEPTSIKCPECKKHYLAIRFSKNGEFLGCLGYPECKYTTNFTRDEEGKIQIVQTEKPKELDMQCPNCGRPLVERIGKFGPFKACSGYPECKYIHQEKAPFPCPECKGDIIQRAWRGGKFWGCSNYPKCKFAIFGEIEESKCPKCKAPFLVRKETKEGTVIFCNNKECGYKK